MRSRTALALFMTVGLLATGCSNRGATLGAFGESTGRDPEVIQYYDSAVYVDALILRDRSTQNNGTLDERLWVQEDSNFNVTAVVNTSGSVVERYVYDPYGKATFLNATWGTLGGSAYGWIYLHQGGRFDTTIGLYYFRNRDLTLFDVMKDHEWWSAD
jgi:hypothetical protein